MSKPLRKLLAYVLSISIAVPITSHGAVRPAADSVPLEVSPLTDEESRQLSLDSQALYWAQLDHEMPWMTEFAFGDKNDMPKINPVDQSSPLVDQDPFFMRSQNWEARSADAIACGGTVCSAKDGTDLLLAVEGLPQTLRLRQAMTPVLETDDYIFMAADNDAIFRAKVPGNDNPGEGMFFITKRDLKAFSSHNAPVPVFFLPLPDPGWTGASKKAFEVAVSRQVVFVDHEGYAQPVDLSDIALLEKVQRDNLLIGITWSFIEGKVQPSGIALPLPGVTLAFGTFLSGLLPQRGNQGASMPMQRFQEIASLIGGAILPQAQAREEEGGFLNSLRKLLGQRVEDVKKADETPKIPGAEEEKPTSGWKRWLVPAALWGGRFVLAYMAYQHIDWDQMIPAGMAQKILTVSYMMGAVVVAAVALRLSVHKSLFAKKYPVTEDQTLLQKINREHKAFLDEFTHASYFSLAMIPQGIRHFLEFLKDRFFPSNKIVHKAWEETMGFQMRQNSKLAMNWKTWWLGVWVYGLTDSIAVFMDLLIFAPYLAQHFGWSYGGAAMAAWASNEVFRNFLSYFQSGAHGYSADVKMIHLKSAEKIAKNQMVLEGIDPDNPKNEDKLEELREAELQKRYKLLGLPTQDEFLYDPNTFLQYMMGQAGFSPDDLQGFSEEQKKELADSTFILTRRHWGLVKPALKKAIQNAEKMYAENPSPAGAKTVQLLKSALGNRSKTLAVAERAYDVAASKWAWDGLKASVEDEVGKYLVNTEKPQLGGAFAAQIKGAYKYLVQDGAKEVRDQRMVLWLMSTVGDAESKMKFLPKSWIERAGSEKVAHLGAELFHRSFLSLLQKQPQLNETPPELVAKYGERAEKILSENPEPITDDFEHQVKLTAVIQKLKAADDSRDLVLNYQPPKESRYGQKQWKIAREQAEKLWTQEAVDAQVSVEWNGMARVFAERAQGEVDTAKWVSAYKYRTIVAREFAKQAQLDVRDPEESEFVRGVVGAAAIETEKHLAQPNEQAYMAKLDENDRRFYEAKVYTNHFINAYVDRSVHSDDYLDAASPEYPGKFQWVRKAVAGKWYEKTVSRVARFFEAGFRNEETSYQPGRFAWFERNVPLAPDMWYNFVRNLRIMPYYLTLSYLTMWYVWQIHSPYALFFISAVTSFIHPALVEFNNRLMRNYGIDPMGHPANKATYSFTHGLLTNIEPMVLAGVADPVVDTTDKYITQPIKNGFNDCVEFLTGKKKGEKY